MVVGSCLYAFFLCAPEFLRAQEGSTARTTSWEDVGSLHARLEAQGLTRDAFPSYVQRVRQNNARRIREGDLDHLVFYFLQSSHVTPLPPIEPALSAKALVESLDSAERDAFLRSGAAPPSRVSANVRARIRALLHALDEPGRDARLLYFRSLVDGAFPSAGEREAALVREYLRAMRFVYEKEFVAQRSDRAADAVADLYRTRGLSTDTAVEAGFLVYQGLGVLKALEPDRRIRRVLIVGPGLDLAPRTGLLEAGAPESYQPWAIADALLALGLSRLDDLEIVGADINPRVVEHLRRARADPPALTLVSEIAETETVTLSAEYRDYFAGLGKVVGVVEADPAPAKDTKGHLHKSVRVRPDVARVLSAARLDIVTERLAGTQFDLVVATNILPYFDDVGLMLAMSNVAAMLAPGGVLLHNEARPLMQDLTSALGFPFEQSRHAVIANVRGAPAPLFDSVWLHRNVGRQRVPDNFQPPTSNVSR